MRRIVYREDSFFFTAFHCEDEEQGNFTIIKPHYGELFLTLAILTVALGLLAWSILK